MDIKDPPAQRDKKTKAVETGRESQRRQGEAKEVKIEPPKRTKEAQGSKGQINGGPISYAKNDSLLSQYQAINAESASKMLNIENSLKNKQPPPDYQSRL